MNSEIKITPVEKSRIGELDFNNIPFGKVFSDHMFVADYDGRQWKNMEICALEKIPFHPATMAWHYGQAIFEGMKAGINDEGIPLLYRPHKHAKRLNISASRMCMPEFPVDIFVDALKELVWMDRSWIPTDEESALYIRPVMMATDEFVGVRSSDNFKLMIMNLPSGPYYNKPVGLYVADKYVRAAEGGVGYAKAAGNYGASLYPTKLAKEKGYDQVMWMDAKEFKYVQEVGTMNIFFVLKDRILTPDLTGTILDGVTRDSVIQILREKGHVVEEKHVSIEEIAIAHSKGDLLEVFGTGTAAVIAHVDRIGYKEKDMKLDPMNWDLSKMLKAEINGIRKGRVVDSHNWVVPVKQGVAAL
ncbi:MAG: branched-chain amino acid aminotransferase [Saprospiraceae bacterium]